MIFSNPSSIPPFTFYVWEQNIWVKICVSKMPQSSSTAEHHRLFVNDCAIVMVGLLSAQLWMLFLPHFPWSSHTRCTNTYSSWLTHDSCTHRALCCQCMIDPLADSCLHSRRHKSCDVITQSMLEILFTFTPNASPALGERADDIASALSRARKNQSPAAQKCRGAN